MFDMVCLPFDKGSKTMNPLMTTASDGEQVLPLLQNLMVKQRGQSCSCIAHPDRFCIQNINRNVGIASLGGKQIFLEGSLRMVFPQSLNTFHVYLITEVCLNELGSADSSCSSSFTAPLWLTFREVSKNFLSSLTWLPNQVLVRIVT